MKFDDLKKQYIDAVYETGAFLIKDEPFELRSGKRSHIYLNHRQFLTKSEFLLVVAKAFTAKIKTVLTDFQIAVVDSIMSPIIAGAISTYANVDIVVVKSNPLEHGTKQDIYGDISKEIVIIDDMTSTGGTIIESAQKIRAKGGIVNYCIVSAYRDLSAIKKLKEFNIQTLAIASFKEVVDFLQDKLSEKELNCLKSEKLYSAA